MKVLVTGGAGFIGSHIADMLIENGCNVAIIDDLSTGNRSNLPDDANFFESDIDDSKVAGFFRDFKPDIMVHTAAQISVSKSVRDPLEDARVNISAAIKLLKYCVDSGVKKVIFSSSGGTVYGEVPGAPATEDQPYRPISPYGIAKMTFEYYLNFFKLQHDLDYTVLRYGNVFGPRQDPHGEAGVVAIFAKMMLDGKTPTINGDGKFYRDYVFVEDVARANILSMEKGSEMAINIGTGEVTDVVQIFNSVSKAIGFGKEPNFGPPRPGDLRRSVLDISRAAEILDWSPRFNLDSGMKPTAEFFKKQAQG